MLTHPYSSNFMYNFRNILYENGSLTFPSGTSKELIYFALNIAESILSHDLSWEDIGALASFANREINVAATCHSKWYQDNLDEMTEFALEDLEFCRLRSTAEGFLLVEGEGLTLCDWLVGGDALEGKAAAWDSISKILPDCDITCVLHSAALCRVDQALSAVAEERVQCSLGNMAIASDLLRLAEQHSSWNDATIYADKLSKEQRKKGAHIRHRDTRALRAEVIDYWNANIDPKLSADKAAKMLTKIFPLEPRTMSKYVSAAKEENTPC